MPRMPNVACAQSRLKPESGTVFPGALPLVEKAVRRRAAFPMPPGCCARPVTPGPRIHVIAVSEASHPVAALKGCATARGHISSCDRTRVGGHPQPAREVAAQ